MTLPVPNLSSKLVDSEGFVIPPWNSWFQQFSQKAPKVVTVSTSPYKANVNGTLVIVAGTVVHLIRGTVTIVLGNGTFTIPISIGDIVSWTGATSIQFLGA